VSGWAGGGLGLPVVIRRRTLRGTDASVIGGRALLSRRPFGSTSRGPQQMARSGQARTSPVRSRNGAPAPGLGAATNRPRSVIRRGDGRRSLAVYKS
jgi:hypothetical protein